MREPSQTLLVSDRPLVFIQALICHVRGAGTRIVERLLVEFNAPSGRMRLDDVLLHLTNYRVDKWVWQTDVLDSFSYSRVMVLSDMNGITPDSLGIVWQARSTSDVWACRVFEPFLIQL